MVLPYITISPHLINLPRIPFNISYRIIKGDDVQRDSWEVRKKWRYYYYMVRNTIAMLLLRCFSFQAQEASPIGVLTYKIWSRLFAYQTSLFRNSFGTKAYARSRGSTSQNGHAAQDFNLCDFFFSPVPSVESPIHKNNAGPQACNSPSSPQMPILPTTLVLSQGSVYLLEAPINKNCHHNNFTAFTTTMGLAAKQCSSYNFSWLFLIWFIIFTIDDLPWSITSTKSSSTTVRMRIPS